MAVKRARMFSRAPEMAATEAVEGAGVLGVGVWSGAREAAGSGPLGVVSGGGRARRGRRVPGGPFAHALVGGRRGVGVSTSM